MNTEETMAYRGVTLRVRPGSKVKHDKMRTAGACRRVWNEALAICVNSSIKTIKDGKTDKPSVSDIALNNLYMPIKQALPWLRELHAHTVRYSMKYLAEAYKRHFDGAGQPDWKRKFKDTPKFTVPDRIKVKGKKIYIPKIGWVRLTGKNPYTSYKPKQATFKYEIVKIPNNAWRHIGAFPLAAWCAA